MAIDRTTVIIAVVGLLILTAAAASISNPTGTGDGIGVPSDWTDPPDNPDSGLIGDSEEGSGGGSLFPTGETLCFPFLFQWDVQLFIITSVLVGGLLLYRRTGFLTTAAALTAIVPMGIVVFLAISASCSATGRETSTIGLGGLADAVEDANESTGGAIDVATDPIVMLLIVAAIGLLVIGVVVLRDDVPDQSSSVLAEGEDDAAEDRVELARIAGETAQRLEDRIPEDEALENEIYRAWLEMTEQLDVDDPETSTPGEFASEAIDAGMTPSDVHELTELFESVRYGDRTPTSIQEQEAIELLSRIEESYGDGT